MVKFQNKLVFAFLLVALACTLRVLQIYNLSPIAATALFSGALFGRKYIAFIFPLAMQFVSDVLVNTLVYNMANPFEYFFHWQALFVYPCYIAIVALGMWVGTDGKYARVPLGAITSSTLFFLVTNFGAWLSEPLYSKDLIGLNASYIAALPFVQNTYVGDLLFSSVFFGAYYVAQRFGSFAKVNA